MASVSQISPTTPAGHEAPHPLDPLTAAEIGAVVSALRSQGKLSPTTRIASLTLSEPPKQFVHSWTPDKPLDRDAFVILLDKAIGAVTELVVSTKDGRISASTSREGVQPAFMTDEAADCERVVRADQRFREALAKRGISDRESVMLEMWGVGTLAEPEEAEKRLAWCPSWLRSGGDNPYAHPIEGVYAIVDLNAMKVLRVEDHGVVPLPPEPGEYVASAMEQFRGDLTELTIIQPEGPSFDINGWQVCWQNWQFRIGFTHREGLVLHQLQYRDGDRLRPVIYRASYAELVVPYGDPSPGSYRKQAFDIGEGGVGHQTNSLEFGCDCLGEVRYFDVSLCDADGTVRTLTNAICLHEEDFGILWKHVDVHTGHAEVRRSRRLVVSSIATFDNYDYAFYWYLYQDGSVETEVKLTGIVLTTAAPEGLTAAHGTLVARGLLAPYHHHFFTARLDMCVDGSSNTAYEVHLESMPPGDHNPSGNAWTAKATLLRTEREAQQNADPARGRYWKVVNPAVSNRLGQPVGYRLVPGANTLPLAHPNADVLKRAGFLRNNLWVTPYDPAERYPSGDYPNQSPGGEGLPDWTQADRQIEETDIVLWYTFGIAHVPRLEDWPVMPVERIGFALRPDGFFDKNPILDVPVPVCHQ
jgi:primary-amine oxidase